MAILLHALNVLPVTSKLYLLAPVIGYHLFAELE